MADLVRVRKWKGGNRNDGSCQGKGMTLQDGEGGGRNGRLCQGEGMNLRRRLVQNHVDSFYSCKKRLVGQRSGLEN